VLFPVTEKARVLAWLVRYHRRVDRAINEGGGIDSDRFQPRLRQIVRALATDPKQFPKKAGEISALRSVSLRFDTGVAWRAVFEVDEATREVRVLALGPHDRAYLDAARRR